MTKLPILTNCQAPNGFFCITVNIIFGLIFPLFFHYLHHCGSLSSNEVHRLLCFEFIGEIRIEGEFLSKTAYNCTSAGRGGRAQGLACLATVTENKIKGHS